MYWLAAISIGFLGSAHCAGMCGPILVAINNSKTINMQLLHHTGRLLTYAMFGAIAGAIGQSFSWLGVQQVFSIVMGTILVLGVAIIPFSKKISFIESAISKLSLKAHQVIHQKGWSKPTTRFLLGMANGILPCGLVYLAIAGAANTFTPWDGAVFMLFFGAGTIPALFLMTELGKRLSTSFSSKMRRLIPITIFVMGCLLIVRGMNLGIPYLSPKAATEQGVAECH
jgi:sulfite exporter TauE/SafE